MEANLAEAIREIQSKAEAATEPSVHLLNCPDGAGGKMDLPVALALSGDGIRFLSLAGCLKDGAALAESQRLKYAKSPDRREGTAHHQSVVSFVDHINRFKDKDSAVWANAAERRLVSVLDYHAIGAVAEPRWGKHRGVYACPLSDAWVAWGGLVGLTLNQEDFAALLDARDMELTEGALLSGNKAPPPSALISLANNLEVYSTATAKRERDPQTGRLKISYTEDNGVAGTVLPPPSFLVKIPVFQDSEPVSLEVRLRVTVEDGEASFAVNIHAAASVLRADFLDLCAAVTKSTELPVFLGTPE